MSISSVNGVASTVSRYRFVASGGETSVSGTDANGATISYLAGKEEVYLNGALLVRGQDYTGTDGATISSLTALVAGDTLEIITFVPFAIPTAISSATVTTAGDLIVATGAGAVTRLGVGADGTTLVANSSASTGLSWTGNQAAGKNGVINGGMDIWQRGTSVSLAASTSAANGYTADRWDILNNANQAMTISRQATGDTTNLPNIQYAARVQRNSGQTGTGTIYMRQSIETANSIPFIGKAVTFSFYARAGANYSAASNYLTYTVGTGTGTDQNPMSFTGEATPINNTTQAITTTWQKFTGTGTLSSSATEIYIGFAYTPTGTAGTNDYFEITGIQIELGSAATTFTRAGGTLQGELAACQRYYWRSTATEVYSTYGNGQAETTSQANILVQFPIPMRVQPTSTDWSNLALYHSGATITSVTNITAAHGSQYNYWLNAVTAAGALTLYRPAIMIANNTASSYVGFSAEL
jgi:hypothetical protein